MIRQVVGSSWQQATLLLWIPFSLVMGASCLANVATMQSA
jgi:hypothetical protein